MHAWVLIALSAAVPAEASAERAHEVTTAAPTREYGFLPVVGGDTDIGLGVGLLGNVASLDPRYDPFKWRVEVAAFLSSKLGADGDDRRVTFQDYYVNIVAPELLGGRLRLEVRPSFTQEATLKYYGLGNASEAPERHLPERDFFGRTHPTLQGRVRLDVGGRAFVETGASYTYNLVEIDPRSRVARDLATGAGPLPATPPRIENHGVAIVEVAVLHDSRDEEIDPGRGQFHALRLRVSPALGAGAPYSYRQLNVTTRGYLPVGRRFTVAARAVGDALFGDPPFYELARFEETSALGGLKGVRGVPAQRYYGKVKLFGNLEARARVAELSVLKKPYVLGLVAFVDAGRLWSDFTPDRALDGTGLGLKYGVGGGVRVQRGKTFVVRADLAWSPDARPVGGYLAAGQMF